jgi:hypothetical protein
MGQFGDSGTDGGFRSSDEEAEAHYEYLNSENDDDCDILDAFEGQQDAYDEWSQR